MAFSPPLHSTLPRALVWTAGGLALAGAVALPFSRPWRVPPPPPPPAVAAADPTPPTPPAPGELVAALARVLGPDVAPRTAPTAPPAGGMVLEGTVVESGASRALVRAPGELRVRVLAVGDAAGSWTLESVEDGRAAFAVGPRRVELLTDRGRAAAANPRPEGSP